MTDTSAHINGKMSFDFEGKAFILPTKPNLKMVKEIRDYLHSRIVSETDNLLKGVTSEDIRKRYVDRMMERIESIEVGSAEFNRLLESDPDAQIYMWHVMLRENHPDMTRQEAERMVFESAMRSEAGKRMSREVVAKLKASLEGVDPNAGTPPQTAGA